MNRPWIIVALYFVLQGCVTSKPPLEQSSDHRVVREGVAVQLSIAPLGGRPRFRQGESAEVRFRVTSVDTGAPVSGLNPVAWLDRPGAAGAPIQCRSKIESFLGGSLRARPEQDLNGFHVVTLNRDGTLTVLDPLLGFGGSKLFAIVVLGGEGADWALTRDQQTIFVSIPTQNEVVVVDTSSWKVTARLPVGRKPVRLALQPDNAYLWISNEGDDTLSVIETTSRREVVRIPAGRAPHRIVFDRDSHFAFVSNGLDGTLSVIDVPRLAETKRLETGASPVGLAYSSLSGAVYAAHADGTIVVVDAREHSVRSRIDTLAGASALAFSREGRWGFLANANHDLVFIIDASTGAVMHRLGVGKKPDQIAFTAAFAYVRASGSEEMTMIRLATLKKDEEPDITKFPAGQVAPEWATGGPSLPASIVSAPEPNAVIVSNPADRVIYYYVEGMAAPMGSFQNYRREAAGVLVVDRSLREIEPGVYSASVRLPRGGRFDVPLLIDAPRIAHCFGVALDVEPATGSREDKVAFRVEPLFDTVNVSVGRPLPIRLRLTDRTTGRPLTDVRDLQVLVFSPGTFQNRQTARPLADGVYEVSVVPPHPAALYVFLACPSRGLTYHDLPHWTLQATESTDGKVEEAKLNAKK